MNRYNYDNKSRGRGSSRGGFGGRDSGRPSLHDAVCDECKKDCQVPFRPSGDKPIYCSDCFEKKGGRAPRRPSFGGRDSGGRSSSQLIEKIETLNTKLDKIIDLLSSSEKKKSKSVKGKAKQ